LTAQNNELIAGGLFTTAFDRGSRYIAAWGPTTATTTTVHSTSPNPSLPGQPVTLTAQKEAGKPVVLSFCRSDCHVCKGQMPALVGLYNQHKDKAVFITLSDEETGPIEKCLQDFAAVQWAVGAKSETYKAYDVEYVPTYVLIDKSGTIRHMGHYAVDGATDVDDLETAIEEFVK